VCWSVSKLVVNLAAYSCSDGKQIASLVQAASGTARCSADAVGHPDNSSSSNAGDTSRPDRSVGRQFKTSNHH